jgi:4-amino-4-deoxy-L-arabinose transferase-like glycosyltransferase
VLPVLLAANALAREHRRLVRALSAVLVALELAVAVSALQRLRVYEQQYGLTELRIYAIGVVAWLVCVFAWASVTILRGRVRRFAIGAVTAGFVATAALNVVNPDALIARTNLNRPQADLAYLQKLSDDAVPTLVAHAGTAADPRVRAALRTQLGAREVGSGGWLSWNASRARARHALARRSHD